MTPLTLTIMAVAVVCMMNAVTVTTLPYRLKTATDAFWLAIKPHKVRTIIQFAEDEIILPPEGPFGGLPFRIAYQPCYGPILKAFMSELWRRFFGYGCVQSGKTLIFVVIPCLYHLFEIGESVVLFMPTMEKMQEVWKEKIEPVILKSRYAHLLPETGAGSRGGKFNFMQFKNGVTLYFITAGASDEQRSSITARVIIGSELDKADQPGKSSREADPITQTEARSESFGDMARFYGECTVSTEVGRIYNEVTVKGTNSQIYIPCPKCGKLVRPEREQFMGWHDAKNIIQARNQARFMCPNCSRKWTEKDRQKANKNPRLVHEGQKISKDNRIIGNPKPTLTFGVRWNGMHNMLRSMKNIAEDEYNAEHSVDPNAKKKLHQFTWALPYRDDITNLSALSYEVIARKMTNFKRGIIPEDSDCITAFIDIGLYKCWWTVWAWNSIPEGFCIAYGSLDVTHMGEASPHNITPVLLNFRDTMLEPGWRKGSRSIKHDLCFIDSSWQPEIVYSFVKQSGEPRYMACEGLGTGRSMKNWGSPRKSKGRILGREWFITMQPSGVRLVNMHSDYWKRLVHNGFSAKPGIQGGLYLYQADERHHLRFTKQIVAEREMEEFRPGTGMRTYWDVVSPQNHYLDTTYGCICAAAMLGKNVAGEITIHNDHADGHKPAGKEKGWTIGR